VTDFVMELQWKVVYLCSSVNCVARQRSPGLLRPDQ